jgi:hypothetical protein
MAEKALSELTWLLLSTVLVGLAGGYLAALLRTWSGKLLGNRFAARWQAAKERKPLGCPVCLGFWCALAVHAGYTGSFGNIGGWAGALLLQLVASAIAAWVNHAVVAVEPPMVELELPTIQEDVAAVEHILRWRTPENVPEHQQRIGKANVQWALNGLSEGDRRALSVLAEKFNKAIPGRAYLESQGVVFHASNEVDATSLRTLEQRAALWAYGHAQMQGVQP